MNVSGPGGGTTSGPVVPVIPSADDTASKMCGTWSVLIRKQSINETVLFTMYIKTLRMTLQVFKQFNWEINPEVRSQLLELMTNGHLALGARFPMIREIFDSLKATLDCTDRERFQEQVNALDRSVQIMAMERMEQKPVIVVPPAQPSTIPTSPQETAVIRSQSAVPPQEASTSQRELELVVAKVEPDSSESPVATARQSDQQVSRTVSPVREVVDPRSSPVLPWLRSQQQVTLEKPPIVDAVVADSMLEQFIEKCEADLQNDDLEALCKKIAGLICCRGVRLGWDCFQLPGGPPPCTEAIISTLLVKDLMNDDSRHCCTRVFMVLWCRVLKNRQMPPHQIIRLAADFLAERTDISGHFYLMFDVLFEEFGPVNVPVLIELMLRGMGVDLNGIEEAKMLGDDSLREDIEVNLGRMMLKMAAIFEDHPLVMRECVFSSFTIHPTSEALQMLRTLSLRICGNKDENCRCNGHHIEEGEPEQEGRPKFEVLPGDHMGFYEPILDSRIEGVDYEMLEDLVTVLHAVRTPCFSIKDDWEAYFTEFYNTGRGSTYRTEVRRISEAPIICVEPEAPITCDEPGAPILRDEAEGSVDSESDSDSSAGSSEFRRRYRKKQKKAALCVKNGRKAAGACHKLKTKDKTRPAAARRSARQLEKEKQMQIDEEQASRSDLDTSESILLSTPNNPTMSPSMQSGGQAVSVVIPQGSPKVVMVSPQHLQRVPIITSGQKVVMNGPKVQVAVATVGAASPQSSVPQTTSMTPVAIKTALSALHLPGQRQQSGREVKLISPPTNQPPKTQIVNGPLLQTNSIQQTTTVVVPAQALSTAVPTMTVIPTVATRTVSTIQQASSAPSTPLPSQRTLVTISTPAAAVGATATIVTSSNPKVASKPATTTPVGATPVSNASQNKTPNFRAILDRFDNLSGVALVPPSFQDCPVKFHVIDGPLKPPNVLIRNPKKLPAAPLVPSVIRSPGKSNLPAMPPDPTRGKISSDLLRRLKEEVDNRCVSAPITQFFKHQQRKPIFTNKKEVAVGFGIRKQGPATPTAPGIQAPTVVQAAKVNTIAVSVPSPMVNSSSPGSAAVTVLSAGSQGASVGGGGGVKPEVKVEGGAQTRTAILAPPGPTINIVHARPQVQQQRPVSVRFNPPNAGNSPMGAVNQLSLQVPASAQGATTQPNQQQRIMAGKIMLLQQGTIATSVNGVPVIILKNQAGSQQFVQVQQVRPGGNAGAMTTAAVQTVQVVQRPVTPNQTPPPQSPQTVHIKQNASGTPPPMGAVVIKQPVGTPLSQVLKSGTKQTVVVSQPGQSGLNRLPIQVTVPVSTSQSGSQVTVNPAGGSVVVANAVAGQPQQIAVSQASTISYALNSNQSGDLFSAGGQSTAVGVINTASNVQHIPATISQGGQQIQQVVQIANASSGGQTITSQAIVVSQAGQRLVTVSPDVLQAAVKSGQTKIITYKPALQQPLAGGKAKVVAAEVVATQQQQQQGTSTTATVTVSQPSVTSAKTSVISSASSMQAQANSGAIIISAGQQAQQPHQQQQQQQQQHQQQQQQQTTTTQQIIRVQTPVQVKRIVPSAALNSITGNLNNNNNNINTSNNNNGNANNNCTATTTSTSTSTSTPTAATVVAVSKASTVAHVLKAPIVARQLSEKERLREITPVLDEDALMEQIMAAEVKEQMQAFKRSPFQKVKDDRLENGLNSAVLPDSDKDSTSCSQRKKRRVSEDADDLRSVSDALKFAIMSETGSIIGEDEVDPEITIENEMSISLQLSSEGELTDPEADDGTTPSNTTTTATADESGPRRKKRRKASRSGILTESALHEHNKRTQQTAAQAIIEAEAAKIMESVNGLHQQQQLSTQQHQQLLQQTQQHSQSAQQQQSQTPGKQSHLDQNTSLGVIVTSDHASHNGKPISVQVITGLHKSNDENLDRSGRSSGVQLTPTTVISMPDDDNAKGNVQIMKQMVMVTPTLVKDGPSSSAATSPLAKKKGPYTSNSKEEVGVSRYKCQECQKGFFSAYNLRRHMKNVHKIEMAPPAIPTTPQRRTEQTSSSSSSQLMAALNGGVSPGTSLNDSDLDDGSLDQFMVINPSPVPRNALTALLEAPPVNSPNL